MEWLVVVMYVVLFALSGASKDAEAATQGSVSYLHGDGYASGDSTRNVTRFDVLNLNSVGMIYGRADVASFDDRNSAVFTRAIGHLGHGLHLAGQLQNQAGISQTSTGVGYSKFGKDASWFADVYRVSSNYYGDATSAFVFGSYRPFDRIKIDGFVEITSPDGARLQQVYFMQPSLTVRVYEGIWAGIEQQRYINKGGIRGLDEVVNQFKIKWEF